MNLLIVNTLPKEDEAAKKAVETLRQKADQCWVIHTYEKNLRPCVGCNACWLRTPGICSVNDGYDELLKEYLAADAVVFLSGTALNFVDYRMKNVIDRILPLATMHIQIVEGQCRHVPRYQKNLRFGLLYSGEADRAYLNRWMDRVMLNLSGENIGVHPIEKAEEVSL
ncbi:MAG: flavodoxin family protein [Clostridia bacterium]